MTRRRGPADQLPAATTSTMRTARMTKNVIMSPLFPTAGGINLPPRRLPEPASGHRPDPTAAHQGGPMYIGIGTLILIIILILILT